MHVYMYACIECMPSHASLWMLKGGGLVSSTAWISSKTAVTCIKTGGCMGSSIGVNRLGGRAKQRVRRVGGGAEWGSGEKWGKWVNGSW